MKMKREGGRSWVNSWVTTVVDGPTWDRNRKVKEGTGIVALPYNAGVLVEAEGDLSKHRKTG